MAAKGGNSYTGIGGNSAFSEASKGGRGLNGLKYAARNNTGSKKQATKLARVLSGGQGG